MDHPYASVRAVDRAIDLLLELSRRGHATPRQLAATTGLDRTTIYRLLATLRESTLVAESLGSESYALAAGVRQLAWGFRDDDPARRIIASAMGALLEKVRWPADFCEFQDGYMVVRESTHRLSAFSIHTTMLGRRRPFFPSSVGHAALSWASPAEQRRMIAEARDVLVTSGEEPLSDAAIARLIRETRRRGYGQATTTDFGAPIGGLALPLRLPGRAPGGLVMVYQPTALTMEEAAREYLPALRQTVATVEDAIAGLAPAAPTTTMGHATATPPRDRSGTGKRQS